MIKSMTGFGRADGETGLGKVSVEVRSVNHRFCDANIKVPKSLAPLEPKIKEMIRSEVSRGRVDLFVKLDRSGEGKIQFSVDLPLAKEYLQALQALKKSLRLPGPITLELLAGARDLITATEEPEDVESWWPEILPIVKRSLRDMNKMKLSEGRTLKKDLDLRLKRIAELLQEVKERFPVHLKASQDRLQGRLRNLLEETDVDPLRFQQEVAFLAERTDITEEVVRAESHLQQFSALLGGEEPAGRKLDFLLQEINREANTISSKSNDAEISQRVVEMKGELEKVREQVQNIE